MPCTRKSLASEVHSQASVNPIARLEATEIVSYHHNTVMLKCHDRIASRESIPVELASGASVGSEQPDARMDTDLEVLRPCCRALIVLKAGVVPTLPRFGLPELPQSGPTYSIIGMDSRNYIRQQRLLL